MVRAIAFDLDGTLLHTAQDIASACNQALRAFGYRERRETTILEFVGDGARKLCERASGLSEHDSRLDALVQRFADIYATQPAAHTTWMPGAVELLRLLQGIPLGVCTNKPRAATTVLLRALHAEATFAAVVAAGDTPACKPSPEPVRKVAQLLGVEPGDLVLVGDGPQDVLAGRAAGARTIAVQGGYGCQQLLRDAQPDECVKSLREVPAVLRRWGLHPVTQPPM